MHQILLGECPQQPSQFISVESSRHLNPVTSTSHFYNKLWTTVMDYLGDRTRGSWILFLSNGLLNANPDLFLKILIKLGLRAELLDGLGYDLDCLL